MTDVGARYQRETGYTRNGLPGGRLDMATRPVGHKEYPGAPRVALPAPEVAGGEGLWALLQGRRSVRVYDGKPLSVAELSQLLWATDGATGQAGSTLLRTAPSAGALYPIETYVAVHAVDGIPQGLYHYQVREHALAQLTTGDQRLAVSAAALDQGMAADADVVLIWSAVFGRTTWKYKQRGYRYVYLDAGHIAQNAALAAVALGLGSCQIAALYDDEANALMGLDGESESVIYMTAVGRERTRGARR
ncbi:MAG: SagB/ThcOx family dehydrogenase [Anaerolineae bacterium]